MLGLDIEGKIFMDRFLIADVVMKADFPAERWFWFDPPFHPNQSVLLHKQADNVWRIDFQLGWDADPEEEKKPENVIPRIKAMLGDEREFELEWVSVYTFQCRRMGQVQPRPRAVRRRCGAPGLALRRARRQLRHAGCRQPGLEAEAGARRQGPRGCSTATRRSALRRRREHHELDPLDRLHHAQEQDQPDLPQCHPGPGQGPRFARALVNSGRLSVPAFLSIPGSTHPMMRPTASPAACCPARRWTTPRSLAGGGAPSWLLHHVGNRLPPDAVRRRSRRARGRCRRRDDGAANWRACRSTPVARGAPGRSRPVRPDLLVDARGVASQRYDARPGTAYLLRPDQHVAARWRRFDAAHRAAVRATWQRAT
jgi:3-(3-hydroxy-phenyl)propionate hydroxylase